MAFMSKKLHVVFLIDKNLSNCSTQCQHCNEVILIIYRLLSAFSGTSRRKLKSSKFTRINTNENDSPNDLEFRWGFKVFNSEATLSRDKSKADHESFRKFHHGQMKIMEARLQKIFESTETLCLDTSEKRKSISHASQFYATALTEMLHDFNWENEDIFASPMAHGRKGSKSKTEDDHNAWCNFVFLLSKAPHSAASFRKFSNKRVFDSEIFLDSIMSPDLLAEYQQNFNISVNWIDMSTEFCKDADVPNTDDCGTILLETCRKLGGKFWSKSNIIGDFVAETEFDIKDGKVPDVRKRALYNQEWLPIESILLEILLGMVDDNLCSQQQPVPIKISVPYHELNDVPVELYPVAGKMFSRPIKNQGKLCLAVEDVSGASFTVKGVVHRSCLCDMLFTELSLGFMLTKYVQSKSLLCFIKTLRASDSFALLQASPKNKRDLIAVLSPQGNSHFFTVFDLDGDSTLKQKLEVTDLKREKVTKEEKHTKIQDVRSSTLASLYHSIKDLERGRNQAKSSSTVQLKQYNSHQIFQSHCLNLWHMPGSTNQIAPLLSNIKDRLKEDQFKKGQKDELRKLKKYYAKEKQPKKLIQYSYKAPDVNTPICATKTPQLSSGGSEQNSQSSSSSLRRSSTILHRGHMMVNRARSASLLAADDSRDGFNDHLNDTQDMKPANSTFGDHGMKTDDEMREYLKKQYELFLKDDCATETSVKTMVTATSQFMTSNESNNPQNAAAKFIKSHLSQTVLKLKEKYSGKMDSDDTSNKIREYKLQVILLLETESLLSGPSTTKEETVTDELVAMLRALSFSIGATELRNFLNDLVGSYSAVIPKLLVEVYEELMLNLPPALAKYASPAAPGSTFPDSVDPDASFSSAPGSSQPSSVLSDTASQQARRSSRFKQHPSFADFHQKKQILVKAVAKPKAKSDAKKAVKEKEKVKPRTPSKRYKECDRAKRNLFSDQKPNGNTSKLKERHSKGHRRRKTTSNTSDKARTLVLATPTHKQKPGWHIQQQEKRRMRDNVKSDMQVVAESPLKDEEPVNPATMNKPARYIVREAFYSTNSQPSRNFARALALSQKSDGFPITEPSYEKYPSTSRLSQGTLASAVRGESPLISPRSRFFKAFISSPSPTTKSKRKTESSPLKAPGRPSRKLAKRLDFSKLDNKASTSQRQPAAVDARLIFDGEDAIDFSGLKSPTKRQTLINKDGWKTPEKQIAPSMPDIWSSASCPPPDTHLDQRPLSESAGNRSFHSALFQKPKSPRHSSGSTERVHFADEKLKHDDRSPSRITSSSYSFSSPDKASRLRSSLFSKSPKKIHGLSESYAYNGPKEDVTPESTSPLRRHSYTLRKTPTKSQEAQRANMSKEFTALENGAPVMKNSPSTPKKIVTCSQSAIDTQGCSTPSKVKFFDSCLISPPTGSGYPPSAEKSTPGKSILKATSLRGARVPRRVELQPLQGDNDFGRHFSSSSFFAASSVPAAQSSKGDGIAKKTFNFTSHSESQQQNLDVKKCTGFSQFGSTEYYQTEDNEKNQNIGFNRGQPRVSEFSLASQAEVDNESLRHRPATVQIRTPSPSTKAHTRNIQDWARRKRCSPKQSPKQNSSSSSNSILSPTSSTCGSEGCVKAQSTCTAGKENKLICDSALLDHDIDVKRQRGKGISRKRGLFSRDDAEQVKQSPCKRQCRNMKEKPRQQAELSNPCPLPNSNTDLFGVASSPEMFEADPEEWPVATNTLTVLHPPAGNLNLSHGASSSASPWKLKNFSISLSPVKRITRQSSGALDEGSLGFQIQASSSLSIKSKIPFSVSGKEATMVGPCQATTEMVSPVDNDSDLTSLKLKTLQVDVNLKHTASSDGNKSSSGKKSKGSPSKNNSTPEKKQYSPSLSAKGLMHLIQSPFVAGQSSSDAQVKETRSRNVKPKSRKHLDLK